MKGDNIMKSSRMDKGNLGSQTMRNIEQALDDVKKGRTYSSEEVRRSLKNPLDEIEGMLAHVKNKTSVELQHEAGKCRTKMVMKYKRC